MGWRAAELTHRAGDDAFVTGILNRPIVPGHVKIIRRQHSDIHAVGAVLQTLAQIDPSTGLRALRMTRPKAVRDDEEECDPNGGELLANAHEQLSRSELAGRVARTLCRRLIGKKRRKMAFRAHAIDVRPIPYHPPRPEARIFSLRLARRPRRVGPLVPWRVRTMPQVVQARCPGCQKILRIPADWSQATLRCKNCGTVIKTKPKSAAAQTNGAGDVTLAAPPPKTAAAPTPQPAAPPLPAPAAAPPPPAAPEGDFAFGHLDDDASPATQHYRRSQGHTGKILLGIAALGFAVIALVVHKNPELRDKIRDVFADTPPPEAAAPKPKPAKEPEALPANTVFPRRILAISVNNYLYANPVSYGQPGEDGPIPAGRGKRSDRGIHGLLQKLGEALHVSESQRIELSDSAPKDQARPPLKSVVENTVQAFLDSSRAQDRIIILFVGHAVDVGDQAYLVPIEGELTVKESLIPLAWLYERMAQCKARQKVLIMDVCRFDPSHGLERPGSGPMQPKLDAALNNPPSGVQVWSACVAKQYSYEGPLVLPDKTAVEGGFFLNELYETVGPLLKKRVKMPIQNPDDPLPLEQLAKGGSDEEKGADRQTQHEVDEFYKEKQTPRLVGDESPGGAAYNAEEPLPDKLVIPMPQAASGGEASRELIASILKDTAAIPAVKKVREGIQPLKAESLPPLTGQALIDYRDDGADTPLRKAIRETVALLAEERLNQSFIEYFGGATSAQAKTQVFDIQKEPAKIRARLDDQMEDLKKAGAELKNERSKRWQANYDYVMGRLVERMAYVQEYDNLLGQIRKDALPKRDPAVHTGWRLASQVKLQDTEARKLATEAKKTFEKLAKKYKGTPWEVLAKRELLTTLGLEWRPTRGF
jgi:hypothetical protein